MSESCSQSVRPSPSSSQLAVMSCHDYYPPLTFSLPASDNGCRYIYTVISPKSGHHKLNPKLLYSTHLGFSFFSPEHHFCIWVCVILPLHIFCCMYYDLQQASTLRCTIWGPFHFIVCILCYFLLILLARQLTNWQHETHRLTRWKSAFHQVTTFATKAWVALNSRILAQLNFSTAANGLHFISAMPFFWTYTELLVQDF